jgi:hypothetical protein
VTYHQIAIFFFQKWESSTILVIFLKNKSPLVFSFPLYIHHIWMKNCTFGWKNYVLNESDSRWKATFVATATTKKEISLPIWLQLKYEEKKKPNYLLYLCYINKFVWQHYYFLFFIFWHKSKETFNCKGELNTRHPWRDTRIWQHYDHILCDNLFWASLIIGISSSCVFQCCSGMRKLLNLGMLFGRLLLCSWHDQLHRPNSCRLESFKDFQPWCWLVNMKTLMTGSQLTLPVLLFVVPPLTSFYHFILFYSFRWINLAEILHGIQVLTLLQLEEAHVVAIYKGLTFLSPLNLVR